MLRGAGERNMTETATRHAHLREILRERRRVVQAEVRGRIRDGRTHRPKNGGDNLEHSADGIQGEMALALLQMRTETLARIDAALGRLDAGCCGFCVECDGEIAERRLRALPFAVRCQACEEKREQEHGYARQLALRRGTPSLFSDVIGS
jgi:DnaK suppressor protein